MKAQEFINCKVTDSLCKRENFGFYIFSCTLDLKAGYTTMTSPFFFVVCYFVRKGSDARLCAMNGRFFFCFLLPHYTNPIVPDVVITCLSFLALNKIWVLSL